MSSQMESSAAAARSLWQKLLRLLHALLVRLGVVSERQRERQSDYALAGEK